MPPLKPGKLTESEFETMKTHTTLGAKTLSAVLDTYPRKAFVRMGIEMARSHHERYDGSGIPKDLRGRIIEKFGQVCVEAASRRGVFSTGLGLPFCKRAIEALGGSIGVESEPGKWSSFWSQVPKGKALRL